MTPEERLYRDVQMRRARAEGELKEIKEKWKEVVHRELRYMLEAALADQDQEKAREWIRMAVEYDAPIEDHPDLHGRLMLLLAMPGKERRGRKGDHRAYLRERMLIYACMAKADLMGWSFSRTWSEHVGRSRPTRPKIDLWQAAGIVRDLMEAGKNEAVFAANAFSITSGELLGVAEKYRPNLQGRTGKDGGLG